MLLKLADTVLILINPSPCNVKVTAVLCCLIISKQGKSCFMSSSTNNLNTHQIIIRNPLMLLVVTKEHLLGLSNNYIRSETEQCSTI